MSPISKLIVESITWRSSPLNSPPSYDMRCMNVAAAETLWVLKRRGVDNVAVLKVYEVHSHRSRPDVHGEAVDSSPVIVYTLASEDD